MGQGRVSPGSKILVSKSNSGLGRTDGGGLARAVSVYGCLRDLREPEVPGRASDGATTDEKKHFKKNLFTTVLLEVQAAVPPDTRCKNGEE